MYKRQEVAAGEITGCGLAELLVVSGEIEDVVNHLEGQTQLAAELVEAVKLGR